MKTQSKQKGITLVALVVTIIILLILAGITISALNGENGLIAKVNQAKKAQIKAEMKETLILAINELQLEKEGKATLEDVTQEWANNALDGYNPQITTDASINGKKITMKNDNVTGKYIIDENLNITEVEETCDIEFTYERLAFTDKMKLLIKVKDAKNGINKIEYPEGDTLNCNGKNEVGIDYTIKYDVEYKFKITSNNGYEKEIIICEERSKANPPKLSAFDQETTFYTTWDENGKENSTIPISQTAPENWYDYKNGKWANVKTVQNGLEAYWVWIPRYEYIVPTSTTATEIEVMFIPTDTQEGNDGYITQRDGTIKSIDGYTIHPTFTNIGNGGFGELDGIWVAKFQASSNTTTPDTNYGGGNDPNLKVQVKPSVQSWRNITTKNMFTVCRKMTNEGEVLEGASVDSHIMKNIEWGAVTLLSQSRYGVYNPKSSTGINGDETYRIWCNINGYCEENDFAKYMYTGFAGSTMFNEKSNGSAWVYAPPEDVYEYNTVQGSKASSTGTTYGVYDLTGGAWEYVAACLRGYEVKAFGVEGEMAMKYLDLYSQPASDNDDVSTSKIGDAVKETYKWWGGKSQVPFSYKGREYPLCIRGGTYADRATTTFYQTVFGVSDKPYSDSQICTFRIVLVD